MRSVGFIFLLAASIVMTQRASADDVETRNAQARFDEGRALAAKGQYDEARVKFLQAYAVLRSPDSLYNLAYTETRSQHPVEAMRHFRALLRDPNTPPDLIERSKKFVPDVEKMTAHVIVRAPDGADVSVDSVVVGRAPLTDPVDVLPGSHTFAVALNGKTLKKDLAAKEGESAEITLAFPSDGAKGNGGPIAPPPTRSESVAWPPPATTWILGGVGVVSAAVGLGFAVDSGGQTDQINKAPAGVCADPMSAGCRAVQGAIDAHNRDDAAAAAFLIAGGVCVAAAALTWAIWPTKRAVVGFVSPSQSGLSIRF